MNSKSVIPLLFVCGAMLSGCRTGDVSSRKAADASAYWQPHRLLISDQRYSKLHVEIDAVEGTAPNETEIAALKAFLIKHTRKPGGIHVEVDDVIDRSSAEGQLSRVLALKHMDGPPDEDSAFLYYLFYDSKISPEPKSQPVCLLTPYPGAILIDHQYTKTRVKRLADFRRRILLHETAHALGLCRNSDHSDGLHCTTKGCLMNPRIFVSVSRLIFGGDPIRQKGFCSHCQQDFQTNLTAEPPKNLRYHGPYIVRSEPGYQVVTRPNLVHVHLGSYESIAWDDVEALRRNAIAETNRRKAIHYAANLKDEQTARRMLDSLLNDPVPSVRDIGHKISKKLGGRD